MIDTDAPLNEEDLGADPVVEFDRWFRLAGEVGEPQPNAMALATVGPGGEPAVRMVLLHRADARGFVFFTNYESRKGAELGAKPAATLLFYWAELERQVRIEGAVSKVAAEDSDRYFATRPREARLGAWASPQSRVIADRAWLEGELARARDRFAAAGDAVPRPPHWGGYRVEPQAIEFWQGRASRLHDRVRYRAEASRWRIERLAP